MFCLKRESSARENWQIQMKVLSCFVLTSPNHTALIKNNLNKRKSLGLDQSEASICGYSLTVLTVQFHRQQCFFPVLYLKIATALKWSENWVLTFWWITSSPEVCHSPFPYCSCSRHKENTVFPLTYLFSQKARWFTEHEKTFPLWLHTLEALS